MLLEMAKLHPERNFLGVEIREPLVVRADRWVREEELRNLHYVSGNINVSVKSLLASYPGTLDLVSVLMPDPWFKKRHKKRRLLQAELLSQLALLMRPGATFFVMSDVQEAAEDMVQILEESPDFTAWSGAWVDSPLELQTEREAACLSRGEPIFRAVFTRL
jgi:tRNA (guanine-N7-)-methyltransferase